MNLFMAVLFCVSFLYVYGAAGASDNGADLWDCVARAIVGLTVCAGTIIYFMRKER